MLAVQRTMLLCSDSQIQRLQVESCYSASSSYTMYVIIAKFNTAL